MFSSLVRRTASRRRCASVAASTAVVLALAAGVPVRGQAPLFIPGPFGQRVETAPSRLPPELDSARAFDQALQRASDAFAGGQWGDGLDVLVEATQRDVNRLAPADAAIAAEERDDERPQLFLHAEEAANRFLSRVAQAAPPLLEEYRRRYEPIAAVHLEEAVRTRDEAKLTQVYRRWFLTRAAETALTEAAAWALERGDFALGRSRLERLHPLTRVPPSPPVWSAAAAGYPLWIALRGVDLSDPARQAEAKAWLSQKPEAFDGWFFPDAKVDVASLKAKLAWISLLEGNLERAQVELAALRLAHPGAQGELAGQAGDVAELLAKELERAQASPDQSPPPRDLPFGHLAETPQWRLPVPQVVTLPASASGRRYFWVGERAEALLPYFPIAWRDGLFWVEPASIRAVELETGTPLWSGFGKELPPPDKIGAIYQRPTDRQTWTNLAASSFGVPRFTATIENDLLVARMGGPRTRIGNDFRSGAVDEESVFVGMDLAAQGRLLAGFPIPSGEPRRLWEGSPVVEGDRMIAAYRVAEPNDRRSRIGIACLELSTGATLWQRLVSSGGWEAESPPSIASHVRPLLAEGKVLVDTGQGTLACLDAATGEPIWSIVYPYDDRSMRGYPEASREFPPAYRDLARGLVRRGVWYAAPQENDRIFAIEIHTGKLLWESDPLIDEFAISHLLGFADGWLIASGRGLVWLDEVDGSWRGQWPEPGQQVPPGHGRGLLVGTEILFPTEQDLLVFDQATEPAGAFRRPALKRRISLADRGVTGGNLVYAAPFLVIAGSDEIVAFRVQPPGEPPSLSAAGPPSNDATAVSPLPAP
ncbi:MAG TPA: PQQ-binding-like beta-propeller repeat protein [Pirellulaceae bacterium]|nr:PQQ-binding-like beta-propeller repeat protein [Pirellulaceae bacterium]